MSKKEARNPEQAPEKGMTKYDLKVQRRKEEKERERKSRIQGNILGIAVVAALVCFVAYFPINSYLTVHGSYIKVNGEDVSRVEFDYSYNVAVKSYLSQYGYYLYMMGLDPNSDFSSQMYSENLTWGDNFQQLAVEGLMRDRILYKRAKEEGFVFDVSEDYRQYEESLKKAASENGLTVQNYVKQLYGTYATPARIKPYMEKALYVAAYYDEVAGRQEPAMEEIQTYYEENKATYDSVDYYLLTVDAQLPTEPTDLADPVEETEGDTAEGESGDSAEEEAYQPSEAEIEFAMKEAKRQADEALKTLKSEGELQENTRKSSVAYLVQDWMFDEARKAGDSTVIEDTSGNRYYVVEFVKRYLNEAPSVDIRVARAAKGEGQAILDEWAAGAATEESFAEICDKYNDSATVDAEGGLLEALTAASLPSEVSAWTHDGARKAGDTAVISPESGTEDYVLYYKGTNEAEWIVNIRQTVQGNKMSEYVSAAIDEGKVEDPKGNLRYLKVQAEEEAKASSEAAQASSEAESSAEGNAESGSESSAEGSAEGGTESSSSAQ